MTSVTFPDIDKTFQIAMNEALSSTFSTGNSIDVFGAARLIHRTEIHYNIDKVEANSEFPKFILVGSRWVETRRSKCTHAETNELVTVVSGNLFRTAYVTLPRPGIVTLQVGASITKETTNWKVALDTWSNVAAFFSTQKSQFSTRGIFKPFLNPLPVQVEHSQLYMLAGKFDCKLQFIEPRS